LLGTGTHGSAIPTTNTLPDGRSYPIPTTHAADHRADRSTDTRADYRGADATAECAKGNFAWVAL
jgi:hypothetical protein